MHFIDLNGKPHLQVNHKHSNAILNSATPMRNMVPHALKSSRVLQMDKHFLPNAYRMPVPQAPATPVPSNGLFGTTEHAFSQYEFELMMARVVDAPTFRFLFAMVTPQLKLPSRAKLSGQHLLKAKQQCKADMIKNYQHQPTNGFYRYRLMDRC